MAKLRKSPCQGSIFRLHVGHVLLAGERLQLATWGVNSSASADIRVTEVEHERRVSAYLAAMTVTWLEVPDEPGVNSLRSFIERNSIALLSNGLDPLDRPSDTWPGRHSPRDETVQSGLWDFEFVQERYDPSFISVLKELADGQLRRPVSG